ncbi:hypothetical protein P3L10_022708 [Capsicum annuum]
MDESEVSPNDDVGKVLGKEHSGRVRCLGLGAVPNRSFKQTRPHIVGMSSSSSNSSCLSNCQENYIQMLNAQKQSQENYKEMPSDVSSGPLSNVNGRLSGDSYSSDDH